MVQYNCLIFYPLLQRVISSLKESKILGNFFYRKIIRISGDIFLYVVSFRKNAMLFQEFLAALRHDDLTEE